MRLTCRETYPVSVREAFDKLTDFDALTDLMASHGIRVLAFTGKSWELEAGVRGVRRKVLAQIVRITEGEGYHMAVQVDGMTADVQVSVAGAEPGCQVRHDVELGARGLTGRLMLQSLWLAQSTLQDKLKGRLVDLTRRQLGL